MRDRNIYWQLVFGAFLLLSPKSFLSCNDWSRGDAFAGTQSASSVEDKLFQIERDPTKLKKSLKDFGIAKEPQDYELIGAMTVPDTGKFVALNRKGGSSVKKFEMSFLSSEPTAEEDMVVFIKGDNNQAGKKLTQTFTQMITESESKDVEHKKHGKLKLTIGKIQQKTGTRYVGYSFLPNNLVVFATTGTKKLGMKHFAKIITQL